MDVTRNIVNYEIQIGFVNMSAFKEGREPMYRHVPEEQVTPVILDKEEQSDDKQEVAEADKNHYNHPGVNWKLELKDIDN